MNKVEEEPKAAAEFIYKLRLWDNIASSPFATIS